MSLLFLFSTIACISKSVDCDAYIPSYGDSNYDVFLGGGQNSSFPKALSLEVTSDNFLRTLMNGYYLYSNVSFYQKQKMNSQSHFQIANQPPIKYLLWGQMQIFIMTFQNSVIWLVCMKVQVPNGQTVIVENVEKTVSS